MAQDFNYLNMKIVFLTDIHQNYDALRKINFKDFDMVLCGGDILDPGKPDLSIAKKIINLLPENTYIVPGNCDKGKEIVELIDSLNNIHKKSVLDKDINLIGIGYSRSLKEDLTFYRDYFMEDRSRIDKFLNESKNKFILNACGINVAEDKKVETIPIEAAIEMQSGLIEKFDSFIEDDILAFSKNLCSSSFNIILTHSPPYGLLDKLPGLPNIGSIQIKNIVDKIKPQLVLCGHFHENTGLVSSEGTLVFNPGAVKDGSYGVIEIRNGELKTHIVKV